MSAIDINDEVGLRDDLELSSETDERSDAPIAGVEPDDPAEDAPDDGETNGVGRRRSLRRGLMRAARTALVVGGPALALVLAVLAGYLKWVDSSAQQTQLARIESVQAAINGTVKLLSYRPDTVDKDMLAARDLLTGSFRDDYIQLTDSVVVPGAKAKHVSATATVAAAASVTASPTRATVVEYINQTVTVGSEQPTDMASTVRVTLVKEGGRWLVARFEPI